MCRIECSNRIYIILLNNLYETKIDICLWQMINSTWQNLHYKLIAFIRISLASSNHLSEHKVNRFRISLYMSTYLCATLWISHTSATSYETVAHTRKHSCKLVRVGVRVCMRTLHASGAWYMFTFQLAYIDEKEYLL